MCAQGIWACQLLCSFFLNSSVPEALVGPQDCVGGVGGCTNHGRAEPVCLSLLLLHKLKTPVTLVQMPQPPSCVPLITCLTGTLLFPSTTFHLPLNPMGSLYQLQQVSSLSVVSELSMMPFSGL